MQLNAGKFAQNGNCGYVLKSDALLGAGPPAGRVAVRVWVLSCQRIPGGGQASDIVDPYVVVEARTHPHPRARAHSSPTSASRSNPPTPPPHARTHARTHAPLSDTTPPPRTPHASARRRRAGWGAGGRGGAAGAIEEVG